MKYFFVLLTFATTLTKADEITKPVRGTALLKISNSGNKLNVDFKSPGENIVGFDYEPKTDTEQGAFEQAIKDLNEAQYIIKFNQEASCNYDSAEVDNHVLGSKDSMEETKRKRRLKITSGQTEFEAKYVVTCKNISKLRSATLVFSKYRGVDAYRVQYEVNSKHGSSTHRKENAEIRF